MSAIEFLISLYGIVLGLSLAEVLSGLGRLVDARNRLKAGRGLFATLGILLITDISLFWSWLWDIRQQIEVNVGTILVGVSIASLYYLAAYLSFPRRLDSRSNLQSYYDRTKWWILGPFLLANLASLPVIVLATRGQSWCLADYVSEATYFALILAALFAKTARSATALMAGAVITCIGYALFVEWLKLVPCG